MNDEMREMLRTIQSSLDAMRTEHARDLAKLQQDFRGFRAVQLGQEIKLDDLQDHLRRIEEGIERLRPPAVPRTLGEGRPTELRQLHSELNALQRKTAELQGRIEVLEGTREP